MRARPHLFAGLWLLAAASAPGTSSLAMAASEDPKLPAIVAKELQTFAVLCSEAGGKALTENAVKRVDVNGDGKDDFVLDVASIGCDGAASIYGDREKGVFVCQHCQWGCIDFCVPGNGCRQ